MFKLPLLHPLRPLVAAALFAMAALPILPSTAMATSEPSASHSAHSAARIWNEQVLIGIRNDFARPTVHARNLFHTSIAMWDAWAAYDPWAEAFLHAEKAESQDVAEARRETISYAVYRILVTRFANSPGAAESLPSFDATMAELGYDIDMTDVDGDTPAALGNRIAQAVLAFGAEDDSNEENDYANRFYESVNSALVPAFPGNPMIVDPNRWQALALEFFIGQSGFPFPTGVPPFLSPEWGTVTPFALTEADRSVYQDEAGNEYWVHHDPGPPPMLGGNGETEYLEGFQAVLEASTLLDPADGVMIDIGPGSRGNNPLGTNDGTGHDLNPATGEPYAPNVVPAGDYYRVLAEFWADGPDSETPPGHWFSIANYVADHSQVVKRIGGVGPIVDDLEWDVKLYLALGGAVHDAAISAWGAKGWYDYIRPVSAIRYMADRGQRSDPNGPSYHPEGLELVPGLVEVITEESVQPGERHAHIAGFNNFNVGKIAVRAWRGPDFIGDPETTTAGVGWILAATWWPYQRPTFVTPPFAGYVSGHSTFSRAAAEVLTLFTGDPFFPGGYSEFFAPRNEFLVFEEGPSVDVTLQWATYRDAADESGISRIYGGIHPRADDTPGRLMGAEIGPDAYSLAKEYWGPWQTLDPKHAMVLHSGRVFARGTLDTNVYGEEDVFDPRAGISIVIEAGDTTVAAPEFDRCHAFGPDVFLCWNRADGSLAMFRRSPKEPATDERYLFWIMGRTDASPRELAGPIRISLTSEGLERAGAIGSCRSMRFRLDCRERKIDGEDSAPRGRR